MPMTTRSQSKARPSSGMPSPSERSSSAGEIQADDVIPDMEDADNPSENPSASDSEQELGGYCGCGCDSEFSSDYDSDDSDEDSYTELLPPTQEWFNYPVDLVALERSQGNTPIYTRSLLRRIRKQQQKVLHQMNHSYDHPTIKYLTWRDPDGRPTKIWENGKSGHSDDEQIKHVGVEFIPRVAFDRDFQRKYGLEVNAIFWLRMYSDTLPLPAGILGVAFDAPYALHTQQQEKTNEHEDAEQMQRYRDAIAQALAFWRESDLRSKFIKNIKELVKLSTRIRKIVCFGMGAPRSDRILDEAFQHMSVFCIANILARRYKKKPTKGKKIQILLQDVQYEERDWTLFKELHAAMGCETSSEIEFVRDPDGLLAIDSHTMVIAPHLPVTFPWAQIIADVFASGSGPAVIMGDNLDDDAEKEVFNLHDRGSSAVARFLSDRYMKTQTGLKSEGPRARLPTEMREYTPWTVDWLPDMDIFVRKQSM
ncbi:uncharacterized protein J4E92_002239 [Alternaria infectoria]|uniref:uncharacterized protein n=1 Tax=Alternaria infectoria TaxID=45303 RepID=UPI0022203362|nr:uncharacterized protein J4E92_002239 [Alternaria infectoria]KAI4937508.1 hypothetical protein J4E92_002239 [Alternaria infectoria]